MSLVATVLVVLVAGDEVGVAFEAGVFLVDGVLVNVVGDLEHRFLFLRRLHLPRFGGVVAGDFDVAGERADELRP